MQISSLVRQSFDIFNVYGKDPSAVENIVLGFNSVLKDHLTADINRAFKEWMSSKSTMPAPADILKLCEEYVSYRPKVEPVGHARQAEKPKGTFRPWVYKPYQQAVEDGSAAELFAFYRPLTEGEREHGYEWLRYAVDMLEYPREILVKYRDEMRLKPERMVKVEWPKTI